MERTKKIKNIEHFCIATSINKEDDEIASFAIRNQISLYRGSLNNVISFFIIKVSTQYELKQCHQKSFCMNIFENYFSASILLVLLD